MWPTIPTLMRSEVLQQVSKEAVKLFLLAFMVPKKDAYGRLVLDGRALNRAMRPPPKMEVLPIPEGINLNTAIEDYAYIYDAVSFFYQIPLHEAISLFFGIEFAQNRGNHRFFATLMVLCMGWAFAPAIAQTVADNDNAGQRGQGGRRPWMTPASTEVFTTNLSAGAENATFSSCRRKRRVSTLKCWDSTLI